MHTHALLQCQLIHIHCTSVLSQSSYGIPYSVHAYRDSLSNVRGGYRNSGRGRVREGDVPPPARSVEAFDGSSSRT